MVTKCSACSKWILPSSTIHSQSTTYPESGRKGSSLSRKAQTFPFPATLSRPKERHSPLSMSWVFQQAPYTRLWTPRQGGVQIRCSNHLIWLLSMRIGAHHCRCRTDPPVNLPLHSSHTCNQDPECLNSSTWRRISSPTKRRRSKFFLLRTMASDLKVLILIPANSYSAVNWSSESWRPRTDEANSNREHSPLDLNVPYRHRDMVEALLKVGVEALSDRRLQQNTTRVHIWVAIFPNHAPPSFIAAVHGSIQVIQKAEGTPRRSAL